MSKLVKQTELELKEKIMDALGRAVADGVLDEAPLPAFIIEVPKERQNGDYSTNVAMAGCQGIPQGAPGDRPGHCGSTGSGRYSV